MKIAVIGSRNISLTMDEIQRYIPEYADELVSGGAKGIDTSVKLFAINKGIKLTEFLPKYDKYKRAAPLRRNIEIIDYSDEVIALWDGQSRGTEYVINECKKGTNLFRFLLLKIKFIYPKKETRFCGFLQFLFTFLSYLFTQTKRSCQKQLLLLVIWARRLC